MKYFVVFLKVLLMIATGACALFFNFFGAISMLAFGNAAELGITSQVIFWLAVTFILFVVPTFIVILKKYIVAASMSIAGMICVFVLHEILHGVGRELYLQLLLITLLDILIAIFGNWDRIHLSLDEREKAKNAPAPSILKDSELKTASTKGKKR